MCKLRKSHRVRHVIVRRAASVLNKPRCSNSAVTLVTLVEKFRYSLENLLESSEKPQHSRALAAKRYKASRSAG